MSQPCDRCGSLRTTPRPLFNKMYNHCMACDEPKKATPETPETDYWVAIGTRSPHAPALGMADRWSRLGYMRFSSYDSAVAGVKSANNGIGIEFLAVAIGTDGTVKEIRVWKP